MAVDCLMLRVSYQESRKGYEATIETIMRRKWARRHWTGAIVDLECFICYERYALQCFALIEKMVPKTRAAVRNTKKLKGDWAERNVTHVEDWDIWHEIAGGIKKAKTMTGMVPEQIEPTGETIQNS